MRICIYKSGFVWHEHMKFLLFCYIFRSLDLVHSVFCVFFLIFLVRRFVGRRVYLSTSSTANLWTSKLFCQSAAVDSSSHIFHCSNFYSNWSQWFGLWFSTNSIISFWLIIQSNRKWAWQWIWDLVYRFFFMWFILIMLDLNLHLQFIFSPTKSNWIGKKAKKTKFILPLHDKKSDSRCVKHTWK